MANNTIQLKRSSVAGKQPNTTTLSIGELALNLTDRKIYSSDGTDIFEPAGNVSALYVGNSSVYTTVNSTIFSGTANNSSYLNGNSASDLITYTYDKTANAYSNAVAYVDTRIGVVNTAITSNAAAAYTNATTYSSNASNISTGTLNASRLPYSMDQNVTTLSNVTFANLVITGGTISTLPVNSNDIVNKQYADAIATGINFHQAVRLASPVGGTFTGVTYYNGPSSNGVGATLTKTSGGNSALILDGVAVAYQDRVLIKAESPGNTVWNGIYSVTNTGSGSYAWVLTRAYDYDQVGSGTNEIDQGDLIYVTAGATGAGTSWIQHDVVTNIGVDPITFAQFSSKALYALTDGTGLYYSVGGAYDGSAAATLAVNSSYIATISSNNASYLGGVAAASYVNTSASYTITGVHTHSANLIISSGSGISANGSFGTANQVLTTNGTSVYWANSTGGGGSGNTVNVGSIPVRQQYTGDGTVTTFTVTGGYTANNLNVYLNGVMLRNGTEVTVTSGSTFTITPAPPSGSLIDAIGISSLNISNVNIAISQQFTANGSANTFTVTGGYVANQVQVFLNGVKQIPGTDVVITSGNTVNFAVTPSNNYVIDVYGYNNPVALSTNVISIGNVSIGVNSIIVGNSTVNTTITANGVVGLAAGGNNDKVFWENDMVITADYTLTTNKNAMTAGPVTLNTGVTVTIPSGQTWTVV